MSISFFDVLSIFFFCLQLRNITFHSERKVFTPSSTYLWWKATERKGKLTYVTILSVAIATNQRWETLPPSSASENVFFWIIYLEVNVLIFHGQYSTLRTKDGFHLQKHKCWLVSDKNMQGWNWLWASCFYDSTDLAKRLTHWFCSDQQLSGDPLLRKTRPQKLSFLFT